MTVLRHRDMILELIVVFGASFLIGLAVPRRLGILRMGRIQIDMSDLCITFKDHQDLLGRFASFNWRLVMAPDFVLHYIVTYEMVHLAVPDHSRKFWLTVQSLCPETERARQLAGG
jgi:Protein of unknown function DUF45